MDSLKVAVRVRPLLLKELSGGFCKKWTCTKTTITDVQGINSFEFDRVYDEHSSNMDVYKELASDIVTQAMQGFHGTLFTYGQSGSGKTFTMDALRSYAVKAIYEFVENCPTREFLMRVSYIELYNEKLFDLLADETNALMIREDLDRTVYIDSLKEEIVMSQEQVNLLLIKGNERRTFAETKQNDRSSRAHCIFRIVIESREREDPDNSSVFLSHLNLVDLAGSEKAGKNSAERLREGCSINRSLLSLSLVIRKLSEGQSNTHISYRDSKLTRILQNALGGNSKSAILCTISPSSLEETISTLRFAVNAKMVKNRPLQNEVLTDRALLKKSQSEIQRLKTIIQKWEQGISSQNKEELERQKEKQERMIEQLRSFLCVSSKVSDPNRNKKPRRRETVCVPQINRSVDFKDLSTITSAATETSEEREKSGMELESQDDVSAWRQQVKQEVKQQALTQLQKENSDVSEDAVQDDRIGERFCNGQTKGPTGTHCVLDIEKDLREARSSLQETENELREVKMVLNEKNIELREANSVIEKKEAELRKRKSAVEELREVKSVLQEKEVSVQEQGKELEQLKTSLEKKQMELAQAHATLSEQGNELNQMKYIYEERELELKQAKRIAEKQEIELNQTKLTLMVQENKLLQLCTTQQECQLELNHANAVISRQENELKHKHTVELDEAKISLIDKDKEIGQAKVSLQERDIELAQIKTTLHDYQLELNNNKARLRDREEELMQVKVMIEEYTFKQQKSSLMTEEIEKMKQVIEKQEKEVATRNLQLEEYEKEVQELRSKLEESQKFYEKAVEVEELEKKLTERCEEIETARTEIERLENIISRGKAVVKDKIIELNEANEQRKVLEKTVQDLNARQANMETELNTKSAECQKLTKSLESRQSCDSSALEEMRSELDELEKARERERQYYQDVIRDYKLKLRDTQRADSSFLAPQSTSVPYAGRSESHIRKMVEFENAAKLLELRDVKKKVADYETKIKQLEKEVFCSEVERKKLEDLLMNETTRLETVQAQLNQTELLRRRQEDELEKLRKTSGKDKVSQPDTDSLQKDLQEKESVIKEMTQKIEMRDIRWTVYYSRYKKLAQTNSEKAKEVSRLQDEIAEMKTLLEKVQKKSKGTQTELEERTECHDKMIQTEIQNFVDNTGGIVPSFIIAVKERQIRDLKKRIEKMEAQDTERHLSARQSNLGSHDPQAGRKGESGISKTSKDKEN